MLGIGRISLLLGLVFLAVAVGLGDLVASAMKGQRLGELLRQGLVICGWVAMWRPSEIFLYRWPIPAEARLYDRLSKMPARTLYGATAPAGAWRRDWPTVPPNQIIPQKSPPQERNRAGVHILVVAIQLARQFAQPPSYRASPRSVISSTRTTIFMRNLGTGRRSAEILPRTPDCPQLLNSPLSNWT